MPRGFKDCDNHQSRGRVLGTSEIVSRLRKLRDAYFPIHYTLEETVVAALVELGGTYEALRRLLTL